MVKSNFALGSVLSVVFAIFLLLFGTWLYMDIKDFQNKFDVENKQFVLKDGDVVLTGFSGVFASRDDIPELMRDKDVVQFQKMYDEDDWEALLETNYKVFIVDVKAFNESSPEIEFMNSMFPLEFILEIVHSDTPMDDVAEALMDQENISGEGREIVKDDLFWQFEEKLNDNTGMKASAFAALVDDGIIRESQVFLLKQFQLKNIRIVKESVVFKAIKFVPPTYMESLFVEETINETTNQTEG